MNKFNTIFGNMLHAERPYSISYMVFSYNNARLSSAAETCDVPVIGYIQSTQTVFEKTLKNWMGKELEWRVIHGGLCGSPEFTSEILESGEERAMLPHVYGLRKTRPEQRGKHEGNFI
jgi:hypothetical protein